MKHLGFVLAVIVGLFIWFPSLKSGTISPEVKRQIDLASPSDHLKIIVQIQEPSPLNSLSLEGQSKIERRDSLVRALKNNSGDSQKSLRKTLERHRKAGKAQRIRPFWIVNAIALEATPDAVQEIVSKHANVKILPDLPIHALTGGRSSTTGTPQWNLIKINAPSVWAKGYTGQDVVIATLDSGVDANHPDLAPRYRGGGGEMSWHDEFSVHVAPADQAGSPYPSGYTGHGTGVTGLIVGGNALGDPIGVAPDSQWIAAKVLDDTGSGSTSNIWGALEWAIAPGGNSSDYPDIINGSIGIDVSSISDCNTYQSLIQPPLQVLKGLGTISVFAAGNHSVSSIPAAYVEAVAVGATDNLDGIDSVSGQGPTPCRPGSPNYPDLVAPGDSIPIALPGVGNFPNSTYYGTGDGTSFASPHVAGAAALLLSAFPEFKTTPEFIQTTLENSAKDLGTVGPDNTFGSGRLDVGAAFDLLLQNYTPRPPQVYVQNPSPGTFNVFWSATPAQFSTSATSYALVRTYGSTTAAFSPTTTHYSDSSVPLDSLSFTYSVTAQNTNTTLATPSQSTKGMLGNIHQGNGVTANRIDGFDLAYLMDLIALNPGPGSAQWDAAADLNGDGVIDNADLAILTAHFGQVMN